MQQMKVWGMVEKKKAKSGTSGYNDIEIVNPSPTGSCIDYKTLGHNWAKCSELYTGAEYSYTWLLAGNIDFHLGYDK